MIVFDSADLAAESDFWARLLGGTVDAEDDGHMVLVDGEPRVGVQLAPGHVPPAWPSGSPKQQMHLDLWIEDIEEARGLVRSLSAGLLQPPADDDAPDTMHTPTSTCCPA